MKRIATGWAATLAVAAVVTPLAVGTGPVRAGPVTSGELDPQAPSAEAPSAMVPSPALAARPSGASGGGNALLPASDRSATRQAPPDPAATGSQLAADILHEAGIGAAASAAETGHAMRDPHRQLAQPGATQAGSTARAASGTSEEDAVTREVKDFGKTALAWLREAVPWLQSDDPERDAASERSFDWDGRAGAAAGLPGATGGVPGRAMQGGLAGGVSGDSGGPGDTLQQGYERNLVREAVAFIKDVLAHPMTWLVVSIFIIGGVAMSLADRRPK